MENTNDFCYVNIKNEIIIEYKLLKNEIDINNYLFIIEKIKEDFNKLLFEKEKLLVVHLNLEFLNLNDITKHYDFLCLFVNFCKNTYPDKLESCFVYKCPCIFDILFSMVSKFLDKKTREKINFIS